MGYLDRYLSLRAASDFDQPYPGQSAHDVLNTFPGASSAFANAYTVGSTIAHCPVSQTAPQCDSTHAAVWGPETAIACRRDTIPAFGRPLLPKVGFTACLRKVVNPVQLDTFPGTLVGAADSAS
jgi:Purine nucleoside permease (NUP)